MKFYPVFIDKDYVGQWTLEEINTLKSDYRKNAKRILKEDNHDHVVYNVTVYKDNAIDTVWFYMIPMEEDRFFRTIGNMKGDFTIGAVHKF